MEGGNGPVSMMPAMATLNVKAFGDDNGVRKIMILADFEPAVICLIVQIDIINKWHKLQKYCVNCVNSLGRLRRADVRPRWAEERRDEDAEPRA